MSRHPCWNDSGGALGVWWVFTPSKTWQPYGVAVQLRQLCPIRRGKNLQDLPWREGRGVLQLSCVQEDITMITNSILPHRVCLLLAWKPGLQLLVVMVHLFCLVQRRGLSLHTQKFTSSPVPGTDKDVELLWPQYQPLRDTTHHSSPLGYLNCWP